MKHAIACVGAALFAVGCADTSDAAELPSVLPHIETMRPLIGCIADKVEQSDEPEVWEGGAPRGPAQRGETLMACQTETGVTIRPTSNRQPIDWTDPETAKQTVFTMSLMAFGDRRDHLTVEDFDAALAIARCMHEEESVKRASFDKGPQEAHRAEIEALEVCSPDLLRYARNPDDPSLLAKGDFLGSVMARMNRLYVAAMMGQARND